MAFFLAVTMAVGFRLIFLGMKTRRLPEWVIGTSYLSIGSGSVLVVIGGGLYAQQPLAAVMILKLGTLSTSLGAGTLLLGCWRIFRPASRAAAAIAGSAMLALIVLFAYVMSGGPDVAPTRTGPYWAGFGIRIATFAWIGGESLRYHALLRRRLSLGLTTPLMAHRFLLWGIAAVATTCSYLTYMVFELGGTAAGDSPGQTLLLGLLGAGTGLCLWLAFFPPQRYRRWIEGHAIATP